MRVPSQQLLLALPLLVGFLVSSRPILAQEAKAPVNPCTSQVQAERTKAAAELLQAGNSAFEAGDLKAAEAKWLDARDCTRDALVWPKAVFNLGLLKEKQGDYQGAIGYFQAVIASHPNDSEPGGNLMETNRNYSHRSAEQISECYEKLDNYRKALDYALLAKTRYPFQSWCGTCLESANMRLGKRIAYLSVRVHGLKGIAIMALAVIVAGWKKARTT